MKGDPARHREVTVDRERQRWALNVQQLTVALPRSSREKAPETCLRRQILANSRLPTAQLASIWPV